MRGGAAEVEAGTSVRGVSRCSHIWLGHHVALEDVAAGEADPLLDVGRPEHLVVLQAVLEVGREAGDQVDELAAHLLAAGVPAAVVEVVRRVLAEHAQQVLARRRGRGVVAGLHVDLAEADGRLAARRALEVALGVVEAGRDVDGRARRERLAGRGGPGSGAGSSAALNFTTGLCSSHALQPLAVRRRHRVAVARAAAARPSGRRCRSPCAARISVPSSSVHALAGRDLRHRARRRPARRRPPGRRRRSRTRPSPCRRARSPRPGPGPRGRPGSA